MTSETPKKYKAILADPPWAFRNYSDKHNPSTRKYGGAAQHYNTMTIDDICNLGIKDLADKDSVLFLWVSWPLLFELDESPVNEVIRAWGFEYKTLAFDWVKVRRGLALHFGMGYWTRSNSEACLLCTRGNPKRIDNGVSQVIWDWQDYEPETIISKFRGHSVKPDEQYTRIELLVEGPYLELFCRRPRKGWDSFGNEIENSITIPIKQGGTQ